MAESQEETITDVVKVEPEKDFFISMLIKDITLRDAIGDLVDNAVDAIKVKGKNGNSLGKYFIKIKLDSDNFSISDNGTGIEEEVAREYAFKLGKPKEHQLNDFSIGRFGIGMKRAFFKIGNKIEVNSVAPNSKFNFNIPVNEWKTSKNWDFKFESVERGLQNPDENTGTNISISILNDEAKENFKKDTFINELIDEIEREQVLNIQKGLKITVNNTTLKLKESLTLKQSDELKPLFWSHTFKHGEDELNVEIYAGVSLELEDEGGWNIFCNERLILSNETTSVTGWTGKMGDGVAKYHQQFYGFRGYVFFKAKKSNLLPWNTTKTGIDEDSSDFIAVRGKMIEVMTDVFVLLNRLKLERENGNPESNRVLQKKIDNATPIPIFEIIEKKDELEDRFQFPPDKIQKVKENEFQKISYEVPILKYKKVKKTIGGLNPSDVGYKTFESYYENEIGD